jgi:CheY-like chemotaxis protein
MGPDGRKQVVDTASDGNLLLKMYKERLEIAVKSNWVVKPYKIVITDLHMPGLSGL